MLHRTFQFIKGIGSVTEKRFYKANIMTWHDVQTKPRPTSIAVRLWNNLQQQIPPLQRALASKNGIELNRLIHSDLHWRMIPHFLEEIAYLDIETTGSSMFNSYTTSIAVFDGKEIHTFVRHRNLDQFPSFIQRFPAIATYFGKGFDIPVLKHEFKMEFPQVHFDLCPILHKLGLKGGLKGVEHALHLNRGMIEGVEGECAVELWHRYLRTKEERYLNTLVAYNAEDVINLEFLLYYAYNHLVEKHRLPFTLLEYPKKKVIRPIAADPTTVREILEYKRNLWRAY